MIYKNHDLENDTFKIAYENNHCATLINRSKPSLPLLTLDKPASIPTLADINGGLSTNQLSAEPLIYEGHDLHNDNFEYADEDYSTVTFKNLSKKELGCVTISKMTKEPLLTSVKHII